MQKVMVADQASGVSIQLNGSAEMIRVNESTKTEAIALGGSMFPVNPQAAEKLPQSALTVEAWVRINQPQEWGGIAGCIQDDGSTEHGWLLGYRSDHFCFAIAGGGNGLTYLTAGETFTPGSWNHVVGTYNGHEMRLYVNGSLAATSTDESGPISYADKKFFTLAGYRDANESFPLLGALHEVRIYSTPLEASRISRLFDSTANEFGIRDQRGTPARFLTWGPYSRYLRSGEVEVCYGTRQKSASVVDLITADGIRRFESNKQTDEHKLTLTGLPYRREVQFQIRTGAGEDAQVSRGFALDTHFDWSTTERIQMQPAIAALVEASPNLRGLAFVVGRENVELAEQLSAQSQFNVVLVLEEETAASEIRKRWNDDQNLVYGRTLSVCATPIDQLPAATAAIVISQHENDRLRRLVRPAGGVFSDGRSVTWKRGKIEGAGVWSHMYGRADNSAFGGEHLSEASDRADLLTQWIGRPGPRYQTDRQNRKPSPLAAGGRLFLQGQQRMIALDSYSGTVLWSVESPTVMRWNVPHDCSNWCADENGVYVAAENQAWWIDGKTGQVTRRFKIPATKRKVGLPGWGYISRYQDQLLGTVVDSAAIYTKWWGKTQWFDSTGGSDTHVVAGEKLFSMDHQSGQLQWEYDGLVLHPTITILEGRVYFVEDKTPEHLQATARRISLDQDQQHELVCLDVASGQLQWRRPLDPFAGHIASLYLAGGGDGEHRSLILAASEATRQEFRIDSFAA